MRIAALFVFVAFIVTSAAAAPSVEDEFNKFELFGHWAVDCDQPAAPTNPHVSVSMPSDGLVVEEHDLGADSARNRYNVLTAARVSPTRLSAEVIFQPGAPGSERQKLIFLVRKGTRRTIFNQPEEGEVRVKDGIVLAAGIKTPVLRKCD
jgi:hypothetical protein